MRATPWWGRVLSALERAARLVEAARPTLGPEGAGAERALALLAEAREGVAARAKPRPARRRRGRAGPPEAALFDAGAALEWACTLADLAARAAGAGPGEGRIRRLLADARGAVEEAWRGYLQRYGLPGGYVALGWFPWTGGLGLGLMVAALGPWAEGAVRRAFPRSGEFSLGWTALVAGAGVGAAAVLSRVVYPRRTGGPVLLPRGACLRRVAAAVLLPLAAVGLGIALVPRWGYELVALGLAFAAAGLPYLASALRLTVYPDEVRVLVLSGRNVVLGPERLARRHRARPWGRA